MENPNTFTGQQYANTPQTPLPNSTAVLVLGIVSIVGCFCYGVPGLICGIISMVLYGKDKNLYALNPAAYTPGSFSNLKTGRICAIIGLSLSALYLLLIIVFIIIFGTSFMSNPEEFLRQMQNR